MPKETIYSNVPQISSEDEKNDVQRVVDIVWTKKEYGKSRPFIEVHAYVKHYGRTAEIECIPLSRDNVNDLIKLLKKARKGSFGADT